MSNRNRSLGILEVLLASTCFGFAGIFAKLAFAHDINVGELLTYRFALGSFILWTCLILVRPSWTKISWRQFLISAGLGVFGYAVFATLYFKAIEGLSVALAALLLYTYPIWVQIMTYFLGEKPTAWQMACTLTAFIGLILLLWGEISVQSALFVFSGLGAAIAYAIYIVVSGKYQNNVSPITSSLYVMSFAAIALMYFHNPTLVKLEFFTAKQGSIILGIAVISTVLPMTLILASLQKLRKTEVALLSMTEPLVATVAAWLLLDERLGWLQIFGGALILLSLALRFREKTEVLEDVPQKPNP